MQEFPKGQAQTGRARTTHAKAGHAQAGQAQTGGTQANQTQSSQAPASHAFADGSPEPQDAPAPPRTGARRLGRHPDDPASGMKAKPFVQILAYWRGLAAREPAIDGIPTHAQLDPVDIPHLLPKLFLLEAKETGRPDQPLDLTFRLAGTELVTRAGRELTGRSFLELGHDEPDVLADYQAVIDRDEPSYAEQTLHWMGKSFIRYGRLALPLKDAAGRTRMVFGMAMPLDG